MTILPPDLTGKVIEGRAVFKTEGCFYTRDLLEIAGDGEKPNRYRFVNGPKSTYWSGGLQDLPGGDVRWTSA